MQSFCIINLFGSFETKSDDQDVLLSDSRKLLNLDNCISLCLKNYPLIPHLFGLYTYYEDKGDTHDSNEKAKTVL